MIKRPERHFRRSKPHSPAVTKRAKGFISI